MNSIGIIFTLSMGLLLLVLPRRLALLPIILSTCYMTIGQKLIVFGLDFTILRILVIFACIRVLLRKEFRYFKWLKVDRAILFWVLCSIAIYTTQLQTWAALINRLGFAYDSTGLYFVFRFLIRDLEDIKRACRLFSMALLPLALSMCVEKLTGKNPFYMFGGVPEFTEIREGVLRCQGPFRHPILAGTFGAVWLPLFLGLWWQGRGNRLLAAVGILSSTLITILSGSSGPMATYIAGVVAASIWYLQTYMRAVRWGVVMLLVALHITMEAPVWFIFARANILSGSTGWHRSQLIDLAIRNFSEWWLLGTQDVGRWGVWAGDITNQYILEGVNGGVITLIVFVTIIVISFSAIGRAMKVMKVVSRRDHLLLWFLGSTLFSHVMTFFSVSYFDQNIVNWYFLLASVAAALTIARSVTIPSPLASQVSLGLKTPESVVGV